MRPLVIEISHWQCFFHADAEQSPRFGYPMITETTFFLIPYKTTACDAAIDCKYTPSDDCLVVLLSRPHENQIRLCSPVARSSNSIRHSLDATRRVTRYYHGQRMLFFKVSLLIAIAIWPQIWDHISKTVFPKLFFCFLLKAKNRLETCVNSVWNCTTSLFTPLEVQFLKVIFFKNANLPHLKC